MTQLIVRQPELVKANPQVQIQKIRFLIGTLREQQWTHGYTEDRVRKIRALTAALSHLIDHLSSEK